MNFYSELIKSVRGRKSSYEQFILSGSFKNLEDYKFSAGKLAAINEVEQLIKEAYKKVFDVEVI